MDKLRKEALIDRTTGLSTKFIMGMAVVVPTLFALDKGTDLSLEVSHQRGLEIAQTRKETNHSIEAVFQTTPLAVSDTNFPFREGIEDVVAMPLVGIINNDEAQQEKTTCENIRRVCDELVQGTCISPSGDVPFAQKIQDMYADKWHYKARRECAIRLQECEDRLQKCVNENVIPLAGKK